MKQVCSILVALAFAVLLPATAAADLGGFRIVSFDADLTILPDATTEVEERIVVEFSEQRHGIYRTIPVRYTDPKGYGYSLGFKLHDVLDDDGRDHGTKVSNEGRFVKIRIGSPDRKVSGQVIYVIRYTLDEALTHFADHDEIYWNVTGNDWNVPIGKASATLRLPAALPADSLTMAGYTGHYGATERNVDITMPEPGVVRFVATGAFEPMEGLSAAVGWPHGYVTFPSTSDKALRRIADNWTLLLPVGVFFFLVGAYRRFGKDPDGPAAVMVQYDPPKDMTPGEIGMLVDETLDLHDISATVIDLAVRGYMTIKVEERPKLLGLLSRDETVFVHQMAPRKDLLPHETLILDGIFKSGTEVDASDLKNEFYTAIPGIKDAVANRLVTLGYFAGKPSSVRGKWVGLGILAAVIVGGLGFAWNGYRQIELPLVPIVIAILTFALFVGFSFAMPRRTAKGVRMRAWARGFEEFVGRVEKEHLDASAARNVFEKLLPYAIALGVSAKWAKQFEHIYTESNPPRWYVGGFHAGQFSTRSMEQSLTGAMSKATQQMAASPRSSGSSGGGGGFSGGGGGGGGGGSW